MNFAQGASGRRMVRYVLAQVKGIGLETADRLCHEHGLRPEVKMMRLSQTKIDQLNKAITEGSMLVGQHLMRDIRSNVERLKSIGCYRGDRHSKKLPVRGQRTHTNSRTARKMRF